MDESKVEQVAKAICAATSSGVIFPWTTLSEENREPWRKMARAAIEAMK